MSIDQKTFSKFLGIIDMILRMSTDFKVTVIPFDDSVDTAKIVTYDAQDIQPPIAFEKGNGGTEFEPLLHHLQGSTELNATLMVLSDGFFKLEKAPPLSTLFLISEKRNMERFQKYGDVFYFDL